MYKEENKALLKLLLSLHKTYQISQTTVVSSLFDPTLIIVENVALKNRCAAKLSKATYTPDVGAVSTCTVDLMHKFYCFAATRFAQSCAFFICI